MILESKKTSAVLIVLIVILSVFIVWQFGTSFFKSKYSSSNFEKTENSKVSDLKFGLSVLDEKTNFSKKGEVSILFGGDVMLDRYIRTVVEMKGFDYVLEDVKGVLDGVDFVVANLEGPITSLKSKSVGSEFGSRENYIFTFPQETAQDLFGNNVSVVSIGNNHILNFGQEGLLQTRVALKGSGVKFFGDPADPGYQSYVKEQNGLKIGFVCYNEFSENARLNALNEIVLVKDEADVVIVYAHWGKEYETHSNQSQQILAHEFIDRGADLIIGSHPHVVQEIETYKHKKIYYSLGNFVFDQYFEDSTREGLLVEVSISPENEIETREIEIRMNSSGKTSLK